MLSLLVTTYEGEKIYANISDTFPVQDLRDFFSDDFGIPANSVQILGYDPNYEARL